MVAGATSFLAAQSQTTAQGIPGDVDPIHETYIPVIPENQIQQIMDLEQRNLQRFDVDFDLPDHLLPEFPPTHLSDHPPRTG
ncbi:MAG: hypothetical protein WBG37_02270 [Desulfobacterales bacterium]